jgi:hypothetical protein
MFVSIFSEGPDGKIVHVVDPTEVADVVAWLEELGHTSKRRGNCVPLGRRNRVPGRRPRAEPSLREKVDLA